MKAAKVKQHKRKGRVVTQHTRKTKGSTTAPTGTVKKVTDPNAPVIAKVAKSKKKGLPPGLVAWIAKNRPPKKK